MILKNNRSEMVCFQDGKTAKTWAVAADGEVNVPDNFDGVIKKFALLGVTKKQYKREEVKDVGSRKF